MDVYVNASPANGANSIRDIIRTLESIKVVETSSDDTVIAVSIGGDGTFLDTVHKLDSFDTNMVPVLGINMGTLGYLTMFDISDGINIIANITKEKEFVEKYKCLAIDTIFGMIPPSLEVIKEFLRDSEEIIGKGPSLVIEDRYMLEAYDDCSVVGTALNDVVVSRKNASIIDVKVILNGKYMTSYRGDGVIVSTATGLTGYSFSCGAPFIDPRSDAIVITPIAAHTVMGRSVILPAESNITLVVDEIRRNGDGNAAVLSIDGNESTVCEGTSINIRQSPKSVRMCVPKDNNFFNRIYKKMF